MPRNLLTLPCCIRTLSMHGRDSQEESKNVHFVSYIPTSDYELCVMFILLSHVDACILNIMQEGYA